MALTLGFRLEPVLSDDGSVPKATLESSVGDLSGSLLTSQYTMYRVMVYLSLIYLLHSGRPVGLWSTSQLPTSQWTTCRAMVYLSSYDLWGYGLPVIRRPVGLWSTCHQTTCRAMVYLSSDDLSGYGLPVGLWSTCRAMVYLSSDDLSGYGLPVIRRPVGLWSTCHQTTCGFIVNLSVTYLTVEYLSPVTGRNTRYRLTSQ